MRSKVIWCSLLSLVVGGLISTSASAAVSYSYVAEAATFNKNANESFIINLYLRETRTDGSASILSSENGLFGAGVRVLRNVSGNLDSTDITDINPSAVLSAGPTAKNVTANDANFSGSIGISDTQGAQPVDLGGGISEVLLGTLSLQTGLVAGESTVFTLSKRDEFNGNTLTFNNFYDLDVTQASAPAYTGATPTNFTVTVVPEPTSLALLGVAGALLIRRRSNA